MKNIHIKITSCICLVFALVSCDSQLDLAPTDVIVEREVFATAQNAEQALSDGYYKLFEASVGMTHLIPDFSLPYVGVPDIAFYSDFYGGNLIATNSQVETIWTEYYEAINVANVFIQQIPLFGQYDEATELQHIGEAKFLRAYSYWALLSFYGDKALIGNPEGLCVPLQLAPFNGAKLEPQDIKPRNTNDEVYTQIIKDLTEAIEDLSESHGDNVKTRVRATKTTAYALLSRVQLYKKDYQACADASAEVLANTNYKLELGSLRNLFPLNEDGTVSNFNDEVIFGFPVSSNGGNFQFGIHNLFYYNRGLYADSDFINTMDPADKRRTELLFDGNPLNTTTNVGEKTTFKYNNPDSRDDIIVLRLAEILLNRAEALAQLNDVNSESVSLLNQIRERSGITPVLESDFASKEELLTALYDERHIETAFEGRSRFDFMRTNRPLRNPVLTDEQKTFPIPQREIDISGGVLVQNPGYN
ncbi:RagB/SusD family nutrient uptake outer membrane protein [Flavivirga spongiicola]|uniref:RagB/SusD family nutrient uptake outer membrane protein n=1 Tax=Flavivirga spongiicola TaxID=421621 RepID=A0ABU7XPX4_9FLAO|nr:RagB/SusD family nutrient uptake outer membrane protein [Flavivirga sp. MEBiC05379]MDO5977825.1 RagB/SusD family nutrient uptake outer membrane protein [Flavivirga sp. MEBiC05379]